MRTDGSSWGAEIDRAVELMRHRGPEDSARRDLDGAGATCSLGHARLRIIDASPEGDQPISNEDGTVWVTFNGELYDYQERREALRSKGHRFSTRTDTETIVHAYEEADGDPQRLLDGLRGMFAFALFDTRRGRLLLARDRFGIKPLYVARPGAGSIAFASEASALASCGVVPRGPDTRALCAYIAWGAVHGMGTVYAGIEELEPGSWLTFDAGGERAERWWRPTLGVRQEITPDALASELRTGLADSVSRHLVADREVGLFLSGGVDSGALARTAASFGSVRSITVSSGPQDQDAIAAAALAERLGLEHDVVRIEGKEVADLAGRIVGDMDLPTHDGFNSWVVSRAAREAGLVVALSGLGGDELFGGYPSFTNIPRLRAGLGIARAFPNRARRLAGSAAASRRPGGRISRAAMAPPGTSGAYRAVRAMFGIEELTRLGIVGWIGRPEALRSLSVPEPSEPDPRDRVAACEIGNYMHDQLLRDTDQMSMAHSLEVRVPLLDDRLAELVLSAPARVRCRPNKEVLRRAARIEESVPKRGFSLPFDRWARGPMGPWLEEGLASDELPLSWLIDRKARLELFDAFRSGRTHWSRPWTIAVLRWWCASRGLEW